MSSALIHALAKENLITAEDTAVLFYDLTCLKERIENLKRLFPQNTLHAVAVKANPLTRNLSKINGLGAGSEVASLPELYLAEKSGFSPDKIVFDSPSKTKKEIEIALKMGIYLNADSLDELDRIDEILKNLNSESIIGLRINPQVGSGTIKTTSVGGTVSKFGVPLNNSRDKIREYYSKYDWLQSIHVHIGSQGCPVPLIIKGIRQVVDLANEINTDRLRLHKGLIKTFDIGGGLPVSYHGDQNVISMQGYQRMLEENFPELFSDRFKLITEFGRYIYANTGWAASKVEYVKKESNYNIAMIHVGADFLIRECYHPDDWHHQISVVDKYGALKSGKDKNKYIIAGPLCFAGDIIARDLALPEVAEGDFILIHDVGAYTLSMWSRYNSRQIPKVIGYNENYDFEVIKERERPENLFEFWS